ncbi:TDT family transporter [Psychromonas aquatilis]|uniref:TDT family transporter n=1 Tax=Psychromonas aquatilis TaxID=2005072 RepID=A0ABU9GNH5_9GAMM
MNTPKAMKQFFSKVPSPLAGLALAIASLGLCWEHVVDVAGAAQALGALLAGAILIPLFLKFIMNPAILKQELQHPLASSVIPTLTMATMVVANAISNTYFQLGLAISWFAIILQLCFFASFVFYRSKHFNFAHVLPSWFIPPIGLTLAIITHPGGLPIVLSNTLLILGLLSYALLLPVILYRLLFSEALDSNQKPITTILATPANLLIVAYLIVATEVNPFLFGTLLFLAVLLTLYVYIMLPNLLRLPFSPAYSAFTFPLVVGPLALSKSAEQLLQEGVDTKWVWLMTQLANFELVVATAMVIYVSFRFIRHPWSIKR